MFVVLLRTCWVPTKFQIPHAIHSNDNTSLWWEWPLFSKCRPEKDLWKSPAWFEISFLLAGGWLPGRQPQTKSATGQPHKLIGECGWKTTSAIVFWLRCQLFGFGVLIVIINKAPVDLIVCPKHIWWSPIKTVFCTQGHNGQWSQGVLYQALPPTSRGVTGGGVTKWNLTTAFFTFKGTRYTEK